MNMLVIDKDTDLESLRSRLLASRLGDDRARLALQALQDLNPHVGDFNRLKAGTVLLVPDSPDFKGSASTSGTDDVVKELQELVRNGLDAAAGRLKAGNADLARQSADVSAVLKDRAFARLVEADRELKAQLDEVAKQLKEEQRQAIEAERTLEAATKGAMAELASLTGLLG